MSGVNDMFGSMNVSVSALQAQRTRMDVIAANLANADSTSTTSGTGPYQRQQVIFSSVMQDAQNSMGISSNDGVGQGVVVASVLNDPTHGSRVVYMPGHPDADKDGNVLMPDIRPPEEMADMIDASRSYEANIAALKMSRTMFQRALEIGKA